MEFEWDPKKAEKNFKTHDGAFQEAATVFGDPSAVTLQDPDNSVEEDRQLTFGQSLQRRFIVVSYTKRGERKSIINERLMDRNERVIYEEG